VTILVSILGLALLILVHEAGHFFTALAVGMRPRKFYLGFPPAIAKVKRNGVEYGIGAIPLGGYVRIPGMHRPAKRDVELNFGPALEEAPQLRPPLARIELALEAGDHPVAREELPELEQELADANLTRVARKQAERGLRDLEESLGADAYWRAPTWKRIAVILAGPGVNIVFAVVLLAAVYMAGIPNANSRSVESVLAGRPAAAAGLKPGDVIVAVDKRLTPTFGAVHGQIQASNGRPIVVTVERRGHRVTLRPAAPTRVGDRYVFGYVPGVVFKQYGPLAAVGHASDDTWLSVKGMGLAIYGLFHQRDRDQLTSTVGIVRVSSDALHVSIRLYLQILGLISLSIALLNLLPLLPLDGGHILFSIIEGIRGRAVAREVYERASVIGFAVILLIAFIALSNDLGGNRPG
jgi:regulator of sigma E protease